MPTANRTCHVCGKRYYFCTSGNCQESQGKPMWHVMFDDANCFDIWTTISDHFFGKISTDEACERLLACDLTEIESFHPNIQRDIQEIFDLQGTDRAKKIAPEDEVPIVGKEFETTDEDPEPQEAEF